MSISGKVYHKKNRILIVYLGKRGGGAKFSLEVAKALINNNYEVYALISDYVENIDDWNKAGVIKILRVKTYRNSFEFIQRTIGFALLELKILRNEIEKLRIDVFLSPMIQPWDIFLRLLSKNQIIIRTLHDPIPHLGSNSVFNSLVTYCVKDSDKIILLSETFRELTIVKYSIESSNIHVLQHGPFCYESSIKIYDAKTPNRYKNKINFLFFGRITDYKGIDILIDSYERLLITNKNITLRIVGEGNIEKYCSRKRISDLSIELIDRWIPDSEVHEYFSIENTVILLPYIEGSQSGVISISKCMSVLIISTMVGGLSEQVNESNAVIIEPNSVDSLLQAMKRVSESYTSYHYLIEKSRLEMETMSWDSIYSTFDDVIGT